MQAIEALDLTALPQHRALWHLRRAASARAGTATAGLPAGQASPMGYWLSNADPATQPAPGSLRLVLRSQEQPPAGQSSSQPAQPSPVARAAQTARLKASQAADGDVLVSLCPGGAEVVASDAAWAALGEGVLLAVCQYWRFLAIDAEIDCLTALARSSLCLAALPGVGSLRDSKRLRAEAESALGLMLDLPHFEGPLTDPLAYCSCERTAQAYRTLAEKLGLEGWCDAIDHRADVLKDTYDAITDKLLQHRNFAWEATLEALIVAILLGELAVLGWQAFAR